MNKYQARRAAQLRRRIEELPELHESILRTYPAIWDLILVISAPQPCDQEMLCEYIRNLDLWVEWVDEWLEGKIPDGDKADKPPRPTWPPPEDPEE